MVPSHVIPIEALPLTANGKVDRKALPRPGLNGPKLEHVYVEPKSEFEELVAQEWCDALKLDKVSGTDNFFELGGHSLLAVQLISRLRTLLDHEIPVRELFEAPTFGAFSSRIESMIRHGWTPEPPPVVCRSEEATGPLSLSQEQLLHLDRLMPNTSMFNMFFVFELTGSLDIEVLQSAIAEIVRRHGALRTVFAVDLSRPLQIIKPPAEFRLPVINPPAGASFDLSEWAAALISRESSRPFDLAVGPLFRPQLLKLADHEHLLLISLHHIIGDQWSMRLFRSELTTLYCAFSQGRPSPLPIPPIRFIDYARWQRQVLEAGLWDGQLGYWREQLGGSVSKLCFQGARKKTISFTFRVARQSFEFGGDCLAAIKKLAQQEACTPYMVVLAALNGLLYFYTSQVDLRVGTLMANRSVRDAENVMGHFLNTTILRISLDPDRTVKQLLKQIRDVTVAAQANQELPFEHLLRTFGWVESPNREALCQVLCNYQNLADEYRPVPGLKIAFWNGTSMGVEPNVMFTTFDLIFHFRQTSTKLTLTVNYKSEVFGKRLISALIKNFDRILKAVTGRPSEALSTVLSGAGLQPPRVSHRALQTRR
jgi:acyl carrier protein